MHLPRRSALRLGVATGLVGAAGAWSGTPDAEAVVRIPKASSDEQLVRMLDGAFKNGYADVNGVRLHYVVGGRGEPLVLLPGWPQTWWQFRKIMPELAKTRQVIAVDLRGMGGSARPESGFDKKTMARDVHELVHRLGHDRADIAGHDIGSMVAFSLAVNHPRTVRRLAMLDVPHPDESLYSLTLLPRPGQFHLWWFAFNQVRSLPEQLVSGRSRYLIDHLCELILRDQKSIDDHARSVYADAYSTPDAIRAGNGWYQAFGQDIIDMATYSVVRAPVLAMYAEGNPMLPNGIRGKALDVTELEIKSAGHYLAEEQPDAVIRGLTEFLA